MNIINLAYPEKGNIKFNLIKYPDGQQYMIVEPEVKTYWGNHQINGEGDTEDIFLNTPISDTPVKIISRFNSLVDYEVIACAVAALRELDVENITLYIPYCLGERSDRKFSIGGFNYIKDVVSSLINSLNFKKVFVLDPHSDVLEACINNFKKIDNYELITWAYNQLYTAFPDSNKNVTIISPDGGSLKKIYDIVTKFGFTDVEECSKHRDLATGKIVGCKVPRQDFEGKDCIIIDDVCDGGRTFIELAKVLMTRNCNKIYLIVTHGIFSAGFVQLYKHLDGIFTTNSIRELPLNVNSPYEEDSISISGEFVKQMDVLC